MINRSINGKKILFNVVDSVNKEKTAYITEAERKTFWENAKPFRNVDMLKRMMKWSNSQKNVWLYLTYTMNESNKVETTVSQLCINTEYTKKVVIEALKFLEAENCIKRKPGVIMVNPRLSWNNLETTSDLEQEYLCFNT